jgi:hypothetical protein
MPQTTPAITDTSSVLSIRRIVPIEPAASPAQPQRDQSHAPSRVGNEAIPHASDMPVSVVDRDRDRPRQVISPPPSQALTAHERQRIEHCAVQLRSGWSGFQDDLVAHAASELDPRWPQVSRQIFEMSARQLLLDQPPSELGKQPVFAGFLDKPGCLRSLLPATLRWLEAHVEVLERGDIERMGTSRITSSKHLYLSEMTTLLEGRFEQALEDPTLLKIFNALHVGDTALAELEALHRASTLQWTAWLQGTPAPNR